MASAGDKLYQIEISNWVKSIRQEINKDKRLSCTYAGMNLLGPERGNILTFVDDYLQPKVEEFQKTNLRELSPNEKEHGEFFQRMYDNRDRLLIQAKKALEAQVYKDIADRQRGVKFVLEFMRIVRQYCDNLSEKLRNQADKIWQVNANKRGEEYQKALREIEQNKTQYGTTKAEQMSQISEKALTAIEGSFTALIGRKSRQLAIQVLEQIKSYLTNLESRVYKFQQKIQTLQGKFKQLGEEEAAKAAVLDVNGILLYQRDELNGLYTDLLEKWAGGYEGTQPLAEIGKNQICSTLSGEILSAASPLWKTTRSNNEVMQLFDIEQIPSPNDPDFQNIIIEQTEEIIGNSPEDSRLKRELKACDLLLQTRDNDLQNIDNDFRNTYQKSAPLIRLSSAKMADKEANFTAPRNSIAGILGGANSPDLAAQKLIPLLSARVNGADYIKPLATLERHRLIFVQEIGGFSLRCVEGIEETLRKHYQNWKGNLIEAKRARLRGETKGLPIPVHIQKEPPFWDICPDNPEVFRLVVLARALEVLRRELNLNTEENTIRYSRRNAIGLTENVDIAGSWTEAVQMLDVQACRPDKEEIERQVQFKLTNAKTAEGKQTLCQQFLNYLQQREAELQKEGGADSPDYRQEATIINEAIVQYRLNQGVEVSTDNPPISVVAELVQTPPPALPEALFCHQCGAKNAPNSRFCMKCGAKLA